ncbi:hypothetical protein RR46_01021 [Papilio xuthus]|uniref:STX17-like N-terminal domain-containing protein n=1 Tax=Papilio xuthus TaxID=66420 RepID=A0A0N1IC52_PAPXU|nr:hypothetical protein RR46_01021 [Papilio xuthus]
MEEAGKLSLKRVELSLTKFNEVAIPHHLDLLRQHKTNIIKMEYALLYLHGHFKNINYQFVRSPLGSLAIAEHGRTHKRDLARNLNKMRVHHQVPNYGESGDTRRLRAEQTHARRVAGQLRALLAEMDALRAQVREEDRARFDAMTQRTRDLTLRAIVDYLGESLLYLPCLATDGDAHDHFSRCR